MDAWTLNVERLQQCCVHVGSTDGEANPVRVPFCARQLFGGLRRKTSAGMVPRASSSCSTTCAAGARRPPRQRGKPDGSAGPVVGPGTYVRPPLSRPEKYERLAFTFCRMGAVGLIEPRLVGPAVFVLVVAIVAIVLYGRAMSLGVGWSKCFLRRPTLIIAFWAVVAVVDAYWIFALGQRIPAL